MEYSAFEFGAMSGGREWFPDYGVIDIGCDEEIDARVKTVSFLEQFVEENNNGRRNDELDD